MGHPDRIGRLIVAMALMGWPAAGAAEQFDPRLAVRTNWTANLAKLTPLAVLDGDVLYMQWSGMAVIEPAIAAYDVTRREVLWRHPTEAGEINTIYLGPSCLVYFHNYGYARWLDRQNGGVLATVEFPTSNTPGAFSGDRVLVGERFLHDLHTGVRVGEVNDLSPFAWDFGPRSFLDCAPHEDAGKLLWVLRELDRTTGQPLRRIEFAPPASEEPGPFRGTFHVAGNASGCSFVLMYGDSTAPPCCVELATGAVTWLNEIALPVQQLLEVDGYLLVRSAGREPRLALPRPNQLHALDLQTGQLAWQTEIPPFAPVVLVGRDGQTLGPLADATPTFVDPLYLQVDTGAISTREAGPSATDRVAWQIGRSQIPVELRTFGDVSVNQSITGNTGPAGNPGGSVLWVWHAWKTNTGELVWRQVMNSGPNCTWINDVSPQPELIALTYAREMAVMEAHSGKRLLSINASDLGLKDNYYSRPADVVRNAAQAEATSEQLFLMHMLEHELTPILLVVLLASMWLWLHIRKPSPREK
jgi:hypothetical protein